MPTCMTHPDKDAVAYCRKCGRSMCPECRRDVRGMIYCEDCVAGQMQQPAAAGASPSSSGTIPADQPIVREGPSPGLALFLGLIPGVGAIYNGQYAKAFLHVIVLGILMSLADRAGGSAAEPVFILLTICFWAYMAGEAYHTARRRLRGEPVDEWSGLLSPGSRFQGSAGALLLILIGVVFLLDTLNIVPIDHIVRYWPVLLIIAGALLLYRRLAPQPPA